MTTAHDFEELANRLTALEERVGEESGLRASLDRDHSSLGQTLRAQHHTLQALSITQSEHNLKIDRLESKIDRLESKVNDLSARMTNGLAQIIGMLERLDNEGGAA